MDKYKKIKILITLEQNPKKIEDFERFLNSLLKLCRLFLIKGDFKVTKLVCGQGFLNPKDYTRIIKEEKLTGRKMYSKDGTYIPPSVFDENPDEPPVKIPFIQDMEDDPNMSCIKLKQFYFHKGHLNRLKECDKPNKGEQLL